MSNRADGSWALFPLQMWRQDWATTALAAMALAAAACGGDNVTGPGLESVPEAPDRAAVTLSSTVLSFSPEADTYIYRVNPSTSYGTATEVAVGGAPPSGSRMSDST